MARLDEISRMENGRDPDSSRNAHGEVHVGSIYEGFISKVMPYGVFVQFGERSGLCHNSGISATINQEDLLKGRNVRVAVREIRPDQKLSLLLLEILPINAAGKRSERKGSIRPADGALVGYGLDYSKEIGTALKRGSADINKVGAQFRNKTSPTLTGHVAEADHTATFNVDAAFRGSKARAQQLGSLKRNSPDILVSDKTGVVKEIGSKVFKTAGDTAQAHRGYGSQDRLSPHDQIGDIKAIASRRSASEQIKPGSNRQKVAAELDEVARRATDRVSHGNVKSTPRTRAKSQEMAEKARKGAVTGTDIVGRTGERIQQGATKGGMTGVGVGALLSAVTSTSQAVQDVKSGKKTVAEASQYVAVEVGKGAADGGVKGMAAGAATAAARVLSERSASQGLRCVLDSSAPVALAITGIEIAKHAIDLARGIKTAEEFGEAAKASAKGGASSFVGAEIGFAIGGPVGAIIGGIAGPMIVDEIGLWSRLDRLFSDNTATGHDGGTYFHMTQLKEVLSSLRASNAVVFPDRVLPSSAGHQFAAEIVMAHHEKVYVVDFKAWIGALSYKEIIETRTYIEKGWIWDTTREMEVGTGKYDMQYLDQLKVDQYGYIHSKTHRNPLKSLGKFAYRMKDRLVASDPRWKRIRIESVAVFPDNSVEFTGDLASNEQFMVFNDFLKLLADSGEKATPDWMLNGLSALPTWDALQDLDGNLYRGLIQTSGFTIQMKDGAVPIPFDAVLKIEVTRGGALSRSDTVKVTLRNHKTLVGAVERQEILLQRKGHSHTYLLRDLSLVCPAFSLFSA